MLKPQIHVLPHKRINTRGGRSHFFRLRLRSCSKFLNPGPAILQIWESDSCSDSGYNRQSNCNLPMFLPKKWLHRLLLLPKWKSDSGPAPFFHKFLTPGPDLGPREKRRILPDSTPVIRIRSHLWSTLTLFTLHRYRIRVGLEIP